ncbi:hypothetical protein IJ750_07200 [bacterium]|nr:hypothetical protein [bacterium]
MNVSAISSGNENLRRNFFIKYANSFMSNPTEDVQEASEKASKANPDQKTDKIKGIETLTIFPKQVIDGKMVITA